MTEHADALPRRSLVTPEERAEFERRHSLPYEDVVELVQLAIMHPKYQERSPERLQTTRDEAKRVLRALDRAGMLYGEIGHGPRVVTSSELEKVVQGWLGRD